MRINLVVPFEVSGVVAGTRSESRRAWCLRRLEVRRLPDVRVFLPIICPGVRLLIHCKSFGKHVLLIEILSLFELFIALPGAAKALVNAIWNKMNSLRTVDFFGVLADLFVQKLHVYLIQLVALLHLILEWCRSGHWSGIFLAEMGALFSFNLRTLAFNNPIIHIRRISNALIGATEAHTMISSGDKCYKVALSFIFLIIKWQFSVDRLLSPSVRRSSIWWIELVLLVTALLLVEQSVSLNLETIEHLQLLQIPQQVVHLVFLKEVYLKAREVGADCL